MTKISVEEGNRFCPQALFLYGTYKEDGMPNFGLFCWCTYCYTKNGFRFVACIGEDKLTRDRIRETGVFSATAVGEEILSDADFCGCNAGYETDKAQRVCAERGEKLNVPIPLCGKWTFELRVVDTLHPENDENSDIYICEIVNTMADAALTAKEPLDTLLRLAMPVVTLGQQYYRVAHDSLGGWGELQNK